MKKIIILVVFSIVLTSCDTNWEFRDIQESKYSEVIFYGKDSINVKINLEDFPKYNIDTMNLPRGFSVEKSKTYTFTFSKGLDTYTYIYDYNNFNETSFVIDNENVFVSNKIK